MIHAMALAFLGALPMAITVPRPGSLAPRTAPPNKGPQRTGVQPARYGFGVYWLARRRLRALCAPGS